MSQTKKIMTICVPVEERRVLLGLKKRGFGEGRWNGFGGKVEHPETIEEAALRETKEEVGIDVTSLEKVGILIFTFEDDPKVLEVHIFKGSSFDGEPVETEEMRPQWYEFNDIPYSQMWPDDIYWLPLLTQNKKFLGSFHFDRPSTSEYTSIILREEIKEVESLE